MRAGADLYLRVQQEIRFVHYTNAEAAHPIITGKRVWMSLASSLNDFREIEHGPSCFPGAYRSAEGEKLKTVLNGKFDGITGEIEKRFDETQPRTAVDVARFRKVRLV